MPPANDDQKDLIISALSDDSKSATITAIARKTGIDRHAVARQLDALELLGKVRKFEKGTSKRYVLTESLPVLGLIDISADLIVVVNSQLVVQYLNNSATNYLNISLSSALGKRLDHLKLPLLSIPEVIAGLKSYTFEKPLTITHQAGENTWFEITILGFSLLQAQNQIAVICTDISGKKQIEEELRITHEKFSLAFRSSPDAIVISDLITGEFLEVNDAATVITGYSRDELIGNSTGSLKLFKDTRFRNRLVERTDSNHSASPVETVLTTKTGKETYISIVVNRITIGKRICLLSNIRDITERITAAEKLRKSEELYRLLANNCQDVIWILDITTGRFTYISPSVEQLRGYTPEEVMNQPVHEVMTGESYRYVTSLIRKGLADRGSDSPNDQLYYVDQYRRDGSIVPTEVTGRFLRDSNGNITCVLGVSRDITKRLEIEEKLRQSEEKYRLISENASDLICTLDAGTLRFSYISPSMQKVFGCSNDSGIGSSLSDLLPPELYKPVHESLQEQIQAFEAGEAAEQNRKMELAFKMHNGQLIYVQTSTTLVTGKDGKVHHIIGISQDITKEKQNKIALEMSEATFRGIFYESPIGHIHCNHYGEIIAVNEAATRIFGAESSSVLERCYIWKLFELTNIEMVQIISGKIVKKECEISLDLLKKSGLLPTMKTGSLALEITITPLLTVELTSVGYLIHFIDNSEKRTLKKRLREVQEALKSAQIKGSE
jgi:PAS domain S-box-containing protein